VLGVIGCALVPPLRSAVLFQDKAGQNRITLWSYSWNFFTQSPKNFVLGAGVRQFFRKIQKPYYDVKKMERLIYPHNIVFNFWSEIGFFGMTSFMALLGYALYRAWHILKTDRLWGATLIAIVAVILVHGLVDVPYFKNDLAMLFWILMSLFFSSHLKKETAA
jgi:O-antigen ligase